MMRFTSIKWAAKWTAALLMTLSLLFVTAGGTAAAAMSKNPQNTTPNRPVQAFDVVAGKVVKTVPNSTDYQKIAADWLKSVKGLAPQANIGSKCGYVFRIPLDKPAEVKAGAQSLHTSDVFLFYCPDKLKLLLVFDEQRKPFLLDFTADVAPFLQRIAVN